MPAPEEFGAWFWIWYVTNGLAFVTLGIFAAVVSFVVVILAARLLRWTLTPL